MTFNAMSVSVLVYDTSEFKRQEYDSAFYYRSITVWFCSRYASEEGALDAVAATYALIVGAKAYGAQILTQTRVLGFVTQSATVTGVKTTIGIIDADIVVLAAGTG